MIFKRTIFCCFLALISTQLTFAQKIKYKDLFILLNAKQYNQAEPFLKKYLKENQDNPNAFLFMGFIYEDKALANDVLRETEKLSTNSDSAILFLDKAFKTIDEREIRKNDEYYQMYSRRDLRTGKFGLSISDIQFDLEKKIKALKDRQNRVRILREKFETTKRIYTHSEKLYKEIAGRFKDKKEFFLRADEMLVTDLGRLSRKYDSCLVSFNDYKASLVGIGKTEHKQEFDVREILDFKTDGYAAVDFFQDEVKVWDYKRWAASNLEVIQKEILPMRESLVKLDAEINAIREKVKKDSIAVDAELAKVITNIDKTGLKKFDLNPMPYQIFAMKISEIEYGAELSRTKALRDSSSLVLKQKLYSSQIKKLSAVDSVATLLSKRDLDYETENYKSFVTDSYGSVDVLKSLIKTTGDFAIAEKAEKEKRIKHIEQILPWIIDQNDSIPAIMSANSKKYYPLSIVSEKYTFGLSYHDSSTFAYFYVIHPSRKATIKAMQKIDSGAFKSDKKLLLKGLSTADDSKRNYYAIIYSEEKRADKTPSQILMVTPSGLGWCQYYALDGIPVEATYIKETGGLTLKIATANGNKLVNLGSDGKLLP